MDFPHEAMSRANESGSRRPAKRTLRISNPRRSIGQATFAFPPQRRASLPKHGRAGLCRLAVAG